LIKHMHASFASNPILGPYRPPTAEPTMPAPRLPLRPFSGLTLLYTTPRCLRRPPTRLPRPHHRPSSSTQTITTPPHGNVYFPPPQPARYPRRPLRNSIYFLLALFIGYTSLSVPLLIAFPPPFPDPGTPEDAVLVRHLDEQIDKNPYVRFLRGQTAAQPYAYEVLREKSVERTSAAAVRQGKEEEEKEEEGGEGRKKKLVAISPPLEGGRGAWVEVSHFPPAGRTLVSESLAGARGVGVQRAFWNRGRSELVVVMFLGGGLCGWPGVTHGGAIGTVVTDAMRRVAGMAFAGGEDGGLGEPQSLQLNYLRPTRASDVHVLRATVTPAGLASEGSVNVRKGGTSRNPARVVLEALRPGGQQPTTRPNLSEVASPPQPPEPIGGLRDRLPPEKDMTKQTPPPVERERDRIVEFDCTLETLQGMICVKGKATWAAAVFDGLEGE
ncbi:hypothetical protein LTS18_014660, partial [Coniosporium uncinatum]